MASTRFFAHPVRQYYTDKSLLSSSQEFWRRTTTLRTSWAKIRKSSSTCSAILICVTWRRATSCSCNDEVTTFATSLTLRLRSIRVSKLLASCSTFPRGKKRRFQLRSRKRKRVRFFDFTLTEIGLISFKNGCKKKNRLPTVFALGGKGEKPAGKREKEAPAASAPAPSGDNERQLHKKIKG